MTTHSKDIVQYSSAICLLISGIVLCYISFFTSEDNDIADGVLWYMGQTLLWAGSIFGLTAYIDMRIDKFIHSNKK